MIGWKAFTNWKNIERVTWENLTEDLLLLNIMFARHYEKDL